MFNERLLPTLEFGNVRPFTIVEVRVFRHKGWVILVTLHATSGGHAISAALHPFSRRPAVGDILYGIVSPFSHATPIGTGHVGMVSPERSRLIDAYARTSVNSCIMTPRGAPPKTFVPRSHQESDLHFQGMETFWPILILSKKKDGVIAHHRASLRIDGSIFDVEADYESGEFVPFAADLNWETPELSLAVETDGALRLVDDPSAVLATVPPRWSVSK